MTLWILSTDFVSLCGDVICVLFCNCSLQLPARRCWHDNDKCMYWETCLYMHMQANNIHTIHMQGTAIEFQAMTNMSTSTNCEKARNRQEGKSIYNIRTCTCFSICLFDCELKIVTTVTHSYLRVYRLYTWWVSIIKALAELLGE
jgi:hypothetical protein